MKILIIGSGRCGSSQLQLALHKELQLPWCSEPFNTDLEVSRIPYQNGRVNLRNIMDGAGIVKLCAPAAQIPASFNIKGCVEFAHKFDLVICLDRRNEGARILSALHAIKYDTWYGKYKPQKLTLRMHESAVINHIVHQKTALHEIARTLGEEVIYLEDLYEKNWETFFHPWYGVMSKQWSEGYETDNDFSGIADYFDPKARYCEV